MKANFPIITEDIKLLPFYVTGIGMKDNQNPMYRKDGYPDFQIALCSKGQGIFKVGERGSLLCRFYHSSHYLRNSNAKFFIV